MYNTSVPASTVQYIELNVVHVMFEFALFDYTDHLDCGQDQVNVYIHASLWCLILSVFSITGNDDGCKGER